jgi:hypothetical protein
LNSSTSTRELGEHGADDLPVGALEQRLVGDRDRRVRSHAAGVRPGVAFADSLMILRRRQQHHLLTIGQGENGQLLAGEELLHDDQAAGIPELAAEHLAGSGGGLLAALAHDRTLAGREPRRLHHQRLGMGCDVVEGLPLVGEGLAARGGHAGGEHHLLGVRLGSLDPRRIGGGPEGLEARSRQVVDQPRCERGLGTDDGQVDAVLTGRVHDPGVVAHL